MLYWSQQESEPALHFIPNRFTSIIQINSCRRKDSPDSGSLSIFHLLVSSRYKARQVGSCPGPRHLPCASVGLVVCCISFFKIRNVGSSEIVLSCARQNSQPPLLLVFWLPAFSLSWSVGRREVASYIKQFKSKFWIILSHSFFNSVSEFPLENRAIVTSFPLSCASENIIDTVILTYYFPWEQG